MLLELLSTAYANLPRASITGRVRYFADPTGEPATGIRAPLVESMTYPLILPWLKSCTYANLPLGSTTMLWGSPPQGNGDPGTGVNAPVAALTLKADTLLELRLVT